MVDPLLKNNLNQKLIEFLACPKCQGNLVLEPSKLVCAACRVFYPINNGIPTLLVDSATTLD